MSASRTHEGVPSHYRRGRPRTWHQRRRHAMILSLTEGLGGRLLDFGCGYGDLTYCLAERFEVVGADVDEHRIAFATREYGSIPFHVCGPERLFFPDATFDVVVSCMVLPFVPSHEAHLAEIRRILRPGGHAIVANQNLPVLRNIVRRAVGLGPVRANDRVMDLERCVGSRGLLRQRLNDLRLRVVREASMYDPPLVGWRSAADAAFGLLAWPMELLRVRATAAYYAYLCRKE